nr:MAG TPA: hypothetical protein [Caudoviricetes sp.]
MKSNYLIFEHLLSYVFFMSTNNVTFCILF